MSSSLYLATARRAADDALEAFLAWTTERGFTLYPAQEEALLEVFAGAHVIVNTPTGSGKSLIALGAHVAALAGGMRSFYTAPIKALVSEKFFALCGDLGAENVGMLTGDASINASAPVVCATAEIVANMALRSGAAHGHRPGRDGRVPLLRRPRPGLGVAGPAPRADRGRSSSSCRRRSATRGRSSRAWRGEPARPVAVVRSTTRPVPLRFEYRRTPLHETIESLLAADQAPLYVVHFTQAQALAGAQALTSAQVTTRAAAGGDRGGARRLPFCPGFRAHPAAPSAPRHRRPPRRDAPEVPPPRRAADPGRPAASRRRDRHPRSRRQPPSAHGRPHGARQVRRDDVATAERP